MHRWWSLEIWDSCTLLVECTGHKNWWQLKFSVGPNCWVDQELLISSGNFMCGYLSAIMQLQKETSKEMKEVIRNQKSAWKWDRVCTETAKVGFALPIFSRPLTLLRPGWWSSTFIWWSCSIGTALQGVLFLKEFEQEKWQDTKEGYTELWNVGKLFLVYLTCYQQHEVEIIHCHARAVESVLLWVNTLWIHKA